MFANKWEMLKSARFVGDLEWDIPANWLVMDLSDAVEVLFLYPLHHVNTSGKIDHCLN
jgi:hypothetical protein